MPPRMTIEERLAAAMYDRSVQGLNHDDAPPWLALPADDRDAWHDLAGYALAAANDLRDDAAADEALDAEGHLREELEAKYRAELNHWRATVEQLERELSDTHTELAAVERELTDTQAELAAVERDLTFVLAEVDE